MRLNSIRKRIILLGLLLCLLLLFGLLALLRVSAKDEFGPQLAGKPASFWLRSLPFEADNGFTNYDHPLEQAGPEIIPILIQVIETDTDRHAAYRKMLRFLPSPLADRLPPPDAPLHRMKNFAAFRLGQFGAAASNAVPALQRFYTSKTNNFGVARAIQALGFIGQPSASAVPTIIETFNNPQVPDSWPTTALLQIGTIPPEAIPHLQAQLDMQGHVAGPAAVALWIAGRDAESRKRLDTFLESLDSNLQAHTAVALRFEKQLPFEVKGKLQTLLENAEPHVRHASAIALAYAGENSEAIIAALVEGLDTGEFTIQCALALAEIGPPAKGAIPILTANLGTNSPALCRAFHKALKAISGAAQ